MNATNATSPPQRHDVVMSGRDLELSFGGVKALNNVDIDILSSTIVALIGPNGAGKTSLLNVLTGLYQPDHGRVMVGGEDVVGAPQHRFVKLGVARTFQNLALFERQTVLENVLVGCAWRQTASLPLAALAIGRARREERAARRAAESALELVGLEGYGSSVVSELSYGLQKRVDLARAIAVQPDVLLLDEPVAGMNSEETAAMAQTILEVEQLFHPAIVLVEHDLGLVMDLASEIVVLDFGEVIHVGDPESTRNNPAVIDAYIGTTFSEDGANH